jgi:hypothetical protein
LQHHKKKKTLGLVALWAQLLEALLVHLPVVRQQGQALEAP